MSDTKPAVEQVEEPPKLGRSQTIRKVLQTIAREIAAERIPPGDQAALRREQTGPAFYRVAVRHLEPAGLLSPGDGPVQRKAERLWAAIVAGLARAGHLHTAGLRLGGVLAEADVAEARVLRLVRAHDEALLEAARAVTHQLTTGGHRFDWYDVAELILSDGADSGWDEDVRRRLGLGYYRALWHGARESQKEES